MNHLFYADDICLLAPSAVSLQELINICATYGEEHDILYKPLKSKCMIIKPNQYKLKIPEVYINDVKLEYVQQIKYFGVNVILTNAFKDDMDIARQLRSLYASYNIILRKFSSCSISVKIQLLES